LQVAGLTTCAFYHAGNGIVRVDSKTPQPPKGEFEKLYYKNLKGLRVLATQPPKGEYDSNTKSYGSSTKGYGKNTKQKGRDTKRCGINNKRQNTNSNNELLTKKHIFAVLIE
jgi:hypothetical protein